MTATMTQIRADIATRLDVIDGLTCYPTIPDAIDPPCAVVGFPNPLEYNITYGPTAGHYTIPVRVYATRFDAEEGQAALDAYVAPTGTSSVKRAVEDTTVAITSGWDTATVVRCGDFGVYRVGDVDYLGCEFTVEVLAL